LSTTITTTTAISDISTCKPTSKIATAVGAAAWGLSKSPVGGSKNITNFASGFTGGNIGNSGSGGYRGGQLAQKNKANVFNKDTVRRA
jgi:hypothetical protein